MRPLICIPMGDPAGIGSEVIVKAIADTSFSAPNVFRLLIVGSENVIKKALHSCNLKLPIHIVQEDFLDCALPNTVHLLPVNDMPEHSFQWGVESAGAGLLAYRCIEKATRLALAGKVDVLATTPINKKSLKAAGIPHIGHTEILAELTHTRHPLTLFQVKNLRVFFLSRHLSLKAACEFVTQQNVINCSVQAIQSLKELGIQQPKLAIAGLNPHSGEEGLFGDEEIREIAPAIKQLTAQSFNVEGPVPADSVFYKALQGKYDAVLSLYHDQGHIATKMVDFERTVSITCGLPFLRTSVDHGTAFDIAGTGMASPVSLMEAVKVAAQYASINLR